MQHAQTQLLLAQASLSESKEHIALLKSQVADVEAALARSRSETADLKQQVAGALERAHLSESHAAQMQQIADHLQSSVSQQVICPGSNSKPCFTFSYLNCRNALMLKGKLKN
jgi:hypothetical protein